jgi:hypothetical protein
MDCQHLDESYELFLLGTLPAGEAADVSEHVERECSYCLEHLREAALTVYLLSQMARPARLDPKLKSRLLRGVGKK